MSKWSAPGTFETLVRSDTGEAWVLLSVEEDRVIVLTATGTVTVHRSGRIEVEPRSDG